MRRLDVQSIVAPLAVMLMLTVIVGYTAYQLTQNWEKAMNNITSGVIQAQILNNIQWQLRQAQAAQTGGRPAEAQKLWEEVKTQVRFVSRNPSGGLMTPRSLETFLQDDANLNRIPVILKEDYFNDNLSRLQETLVQLKTGSRRVTVTITLCMAILGVLLMGITAFDLTRLFGELGRSRDLNNKIQEEERQRIAQELHDAVIQELVDLKRAYQPEKVDQLVEAIRRICHNLKPQILEDLGLAAAIELLADDLREQGKRTVTLSLEEEGLQALSKDYELSLFRIVQELFNNVKRHARATQAALTLVYNPAESPMLRLYVHDNGCGFDPVTAKRSLGITGITERVCQLGGKMTITSDPGDEGGSRFQILIPVQRRRLHDGPIPG